MAINRFVNNAPVARFSPMSMQEMAYAPEILREREDTMLNQIDELSNLMYNVQVPDQYQDMLASERDAFTQELDKLASNIRESGSNDLTYFNDLRRLRNRYNKNISASGAIGKAARLHEQEKIARQQFMEAGFQTGWVNAPESLERYYNDQRDKYMKELENTDLSKPGEVPEFRPKFAPAFMSLDNEMLKLRSLVGQVGKAIPPDSRLIPNGKGGFAIQTTSGKTITNEPNLDALNQYIRNQALDKDSQLAKNLAIRGMSPEEFISNANLFTQISLIEDTNISSKISGAGGSGGSANKKKDAASGAGFTEVESGTPYVSYTGEPVTTVGDTKRELAAIEESRAAGNISPDQYEREKNHMTIVQKHREAYERTPEYQAKLDQAIEESANKVQISEVEEGGKWLWPLLNPAVGVAGLMGMDSKLQELTTALGLESSAGGTLQQYGITDREQYDEFMNSPEAQETAIGLGKTAMIPSLDGPIPLMPTPLNLGLSKGDIVRKAWDTINASIKNPMTQGTDFRAISIDPKSQKWAKEFNQGTTMHFDMVDAVLKGSIDYIGPGEDSWVTSRTLNEDWEDSSLNKFMSGAEKIEYNIKGLDMGTMSKEPGIMMELTGKVDDEMKTFTVVRKLKKNDDWTQQLLNREGHFYKSLNPQSQMTFEVMRDNLTYNTTPLSADSSDASFNAMNTRNIQAQALQRDRRLGRAGKSKNDRIHKEKFINPYDTNYDYAVVVNEDMSYTPTRKNKQTGSTEALTFKDYFREELGGQPASAGPQGITQGVYSIEQSTFSIDNPSESAMIYSADPKYTQALNTFYNETRGLAPNTQEYQTAALKFYKNIENMRVSLRSIAEAL